MYLVSPPQYHGTSLKGCNDARSSSHGVFERHRDMQSRQERDSFYSTVGAHPNLGYYLYMEPSDCHVLQISFERKASSDKS